MYGLFIDDGGMQRGSDPSTQRCTPSMSGIVCTNFWDRRVSLAASCEISWTTLRLGYLKEADMKIRDDDLWGIESQLVCALPQGERMFT